MSANSMWSQAVHWRTRMQCNRSKGVTFHCTLCPVPAYFYL